MPDDGLCVQRCLQGGTGHVVPSFKTFLNARTKWRYFSPPEDTPHREGATQRQNIPCPPNTLEQPEPTLHGDHGPPQPAAGQADHWAATMMTNQTKCWQQRNDLTCRHAATRLTTTKHTGREANDRGDSLQRPNAAGQAHTGHRTTPDKPTTGGHDNGAPTQHARHSPVATQRPHRTGGPPQISELTGTTTKTKSGYTGTGCSAIDPTMHKPTIRRLTEPGTNQTAAQKTTRQ